MWIFTKYGFYSAVQDESNSDTIKVRARLREDLVRLIEACNLKVEIVETNDTDYAYRVFVTRPQLARIMLEMVDTLDYTNFKNEVYAQQGFERYNAYHEVWDVMYKLQVKERGVGSMYWYSISK